MRKSKSFLALSGLLGFVVLIPLGCSHYYEDYYLSLTDPKLASGGTGGMGGSGGTGGAPPECAGEPSEANVTDACGVFVQADATGAVDAEDGTQAHPYTSLQTALKAAGSKRVYACSSAPYAEAVTVAAPVEVYGGFTCAKGWAWTTEGRSVLKGPAGAVALTLTKAAEGAKVHGFAITAADATTKGGSSIAVAVEDIAAALIRCEVTAGDGMAGEDGLKASGTATKGMDAPPPDAKTMDACINGASMFLVGGAPGTLTCDDGVTAGGLGGKGGLTGDGAKGADGTPGDGTNGLGGAGESMTKCQVGTAGADGVAGPKGPAGSLPGALSLAGLSDTNMTDGKAGGRGNGGGGGGGAKFGAGGACADGADGNGASGGGGGAGGCGGKGGGGGKAGGSSLAIVSLGAKLVLTEVTLTTGKGGNGGKGVVGQSGGAVGAGAFGGAASGAVTAGCQGGNGGAGGLGGSGGGGRGGHSVGIAYASGPSKAATVKGFTGDTMGVGGAAGPSNPMGTGAKGAAGACWDFSKNAGCAQ